MPDYTLGIDIGTTSVKVVLLSSEGFIADEASASHDLISLRPNWAEEDAEIWWGGVIDALRQLHGRCADKFPRIRCIGCGGMVPAIVLLDADDRPLRATIQQNDARAISQIERITAALDQDRLFALTGGRTNQQHILPRLLWVKENEPEVWGRVRYIMGSYDYIVYRLTGQKSLELNWAAESGAFDIRRREWLRGDLERFGVSPGWLPPVNEPTRVVGETQPFLTQLCGLPAGIPVIAGSADHVASALAAGIVEQEDLLIKFGGAGDILYCTDKLETSERLFFDYHDVPGKYLINGCMAASGSLVKWFTRDIAGDEDLKALDERAALLPPASDGLIILPYFLGEKTPIFDPAARGVMFGLTLSHTRAHIFRAILESVIYGFRHHIEVIGEMGHSPRRIIATNGGAKSRFWCQIAADVLNRPVRAYPGHPGSALGVAFLAGVSAGVYKSWDEVNRFLTDYRVFEPDERSVLVYDRAYAVYRDLYPRLRPDAEALQKLYI